MRYLMKNFLKVVFVISSVVAILGAVYYFFMKFQSLQAASEEGEYDDLDEFGETDTDRSYVSIPPTESEETVTEDFLDEE